MIICQIVFLSQGPVPTVLPGCSGVSGKLWSLCNITPPIRTPSEEFPLSHIHSAPSAPMAWRGSYEGRWRGGDHSRTRRGHSATSSRTGAMILPQTRHQNLPKPNPERHVVMPHSDSWLNLPVTPQFLPAPNSKKYISAIFIYIHHYDIMTI